MARAKHPISWLFYSADHGEHVTGKGGAFHGDFNDELIHNSFLVFPPYANYDVIAVQVEHLYLRQIFLPLC